MHKEILTNLNEVQDMDNVIHAIAGKKGSTNYWIMRYTFFSTRVHETTNLCTGWIYYNKAYNSWNT